MHTIQGLLDAAKDASSIKSDYRLAKVLEVTEKTVANWRHGRSVPEEANAFLLAKHSGLDPFYVLACCKAASSIPDETKTLWLSLAKRLQAPAAVALSAIFALVLLHLGQSQGVDLAYVFPALLVDSKQFTPYTLSQVWPLASVFPCVAYLSRLFPRI